MPRRRITSGKLKTEVYTNGLIASARNLSVTKPLPPKKIKQQAWQEQAFYWYDTIEVYHYACQWIANTLSRAKLIVRENGAETTNQAALDALESFFGGSKNHPEFLRQTGIQLTVAGDEYVVGQEIDGEDDWCVAAAVAVKQGPDGYRIHGEEINESSTFLMRLWRPHPRRPDFSDSPTRPLLPMLSQLDELTKYTAAQLDSRLMGAGILKIPNEMSFPTPSAADGKEQQTAANAFVQELAETMAEAKADRGSASASVPIMLQGPGEYLDKVDILTFWSALDEHVAAMVDATIRRIALGLDMPPESLLGTGDLNHWGAWQLDDLVIKTHIEPFLQIITEGLSEQYLQVILEEGGMLPEQAATFTIEADTVDMRLRPDLSKQTLELWDRGLLAGSIVRRESGFEETDKMLPDEQKMWLAQKISGGSATPDQVAAAAKIFANLELPDGVSVHETITDNISEDAPETPAPRSLEEHPKRDIPDTRDNAQAAALLATSEAAVFRALERCGNRLRTAKPAIALPPTVEKMDLYQYVTLSKSQLDHVMVDAWGQLGRFSIESVSVEKLETQLDLYTRMLIMSQQPYDRSILARYLDLVGA